MTKNTTHTSQMARAISDLSDLSYAQARNLVVAQRDAGQLPPVLDDVSLAAAVDRIVAQHTAGATLRPPIPTTTAKVIAFVSGKGGVGVTTLAVAFASRLAALTTKRVCLFDTHFNQSDVGMLLGYWSPDVMHLLAAHAATGTWDLDECAITHQPLGMDLLLAPSTPDRADPTLLHGTTLLSVLEVLRTAYDYVVLDTPHTTSFHDLYREAIFPATDYLVAVSTPDYQALLAADRLLRDANAEAAPTHPQLGCLLNQVAPADRISPDEARRELAAWPYLGQLPHDLSWRGVTGDAIVDLLSDPAVANPYDELVRAVTEEGAPGPARP
jgi:MinD-like ATPase involved in chromosome partitioning or flagellar assembly